MVDGWQTVSPTSASGDRMGLPLENIASMYGYHYVGTEETYPWTVEPYEITLIHSLLNQQNLVFPSTTPMMTLVSLTRMGIPTDRYRRICHWSPHGSWR